MCVPRLCYRSSRMQVRGATAFVVGASVSSRAGPTALGWHRPCWSAADAGHDRPHRARGLEGAVGMSELQQRDVSRYCIGAAWRGAFAAGLATLAGCLMTGEGVGIARSFGPLLLCLCPMLGYYAIARPS